MKAPLLALCLAACGPATTPGVTNNSINIEQSITWTLAKSPYTVDGDMYVGSSANPVLTIEPGVTVKFNAGASLRIGRNGQGALKAVGTLDKHIIFTSSSATATAGDWKGIFFTATTDSANTRFEYVDMGGAGDVDTRGAINSESVNINFINTTVTGGKGYGFAFTGGSGFGERSYGISVKAVEKSAVLIDFNKVGTVPAASSLYADNTVPGVEIRSGGTLATTQTMRNINAPWYFPGDAYISGSGPPVLSIEGGARLEFEAGTVFNIGGSSAGALKTLGDFSNRVTFTSHATSKTKGTWAGLYFYPNASGQSRLDGTLIEYAGLLPTSGGVTIENSAPIFSDVTITNSKGAGLLLVGNGMLGLNSVGLVVNANAGPGVSVNNGDSVGSLPYIDSQYIGNTGPGVLVAEGATVTKDAQWYAIGTPYVMKGDLNVDGAQGSSAMLTLNAGVQLAFPPAAQLSIGTSNAASLRALGNANAHVQFISSLATPVPGSWYGLRFYEHSIPNTAPRGSQFTQADILFAGPTSNRSALMATMNVWLPSFSSCSIVNAVFALCIENKSLLPNLSITATNNFCL